MFSRSLSRADAMRALLEDGLASHESEEDGLDEDEEYAPDALIEILSRDTTVPDADA